MADHTDAGALRRRIILNYAEQQQKVYRPERLKGYDYSQPDGYLISLTAKVRGEDILCSIDGKREAESPAGPPTWADQSLNNQVCESSNSQIPNRALLSGSLRQGRLFGS